MSAQTPTRDGTVLLSPSDAAKLANVSRETIYREIDRGALPALHVGRQLRIDPGVPVVHAWWRGCGVSRRDKAIDQELDSVTSALVHLDRRETGLDRRLEAVEGKLRTDQIQTARDRGLPADLVSTETNVWRRLSPARNRWPEIAAYDERVAELEMRQAAKAPVIREQIRERQEEWEALTRATARVLAAKTEFVEKHRGRLVKEADSYASEAHARYLELVDQLADARADLAAKRSAAVWARLYPAEQAGRGPADTFAGGRKRPLQAMGLSANVEPGRVFDALRADAEWLADAASPEQRVGYRRHRRPQAAEHRVGERPAAKAQRDKAMADWANSRCGYQSRPVRAASLRVRPQGGAQGLGPPGDGRRGGLLALR